MNLGAFVWWDSLQSSKPCSWRVFNVMENAHERLGRGKKGAGLQVVYSIIPHCVCMHTCVSIMEEPVKMGKQSHKVGQCW